VRGPRSLRRRRPPRRARQDVARCE